MSPLGAMRPLATGQRAFLAVLAASAVLAAAPASAGDCTFVVLAKGVTGDAFWDPDRWDWCRDEWVNFWRALFGMHHQDWTGDGWEFPCSTGGDAPNAARTVYMGRTNTAILTLCYSKADMPSRLDDRTGNMLHWGCGWAATTIDNLQAKCGTGGGAPRPAANKNPFLGTQRIELYGGGGTSSFFFQDIVWRASILVHEARHWDDVKEHNAATGTFPSRDSSWDYEGANMFQAVWLAWYANSATRAPKGMRCKAWHYANEIMLNKSGAYFRTSPPMALSDQMATISCD